MSKKTNVQIRIDEIDEQVKTLTIVRDVLVSIRGDKPSKAKRKATREVPGFQSEATDKRPRVGGEGKLS